MQDFITSEIMSSEPQQSDASEHYITNAGLVILYPFLKELYGNLNLCKRRFFISDEHKIKATLLLQYLATGKLFNANENLLLNKILCGYTIEKDLPNYYLNDMEKKQCDLLMSTIVNHWPELKVNDADSLRYSFLLRNGTLADKGQYWLLKVEHKAYDGLLKFLPWSLGIIYIPWMQKRILIKWKI